MFTCYVKHLFNGIYFVQEQLFPKQKAIEPMSVAGGPRMAADIGLIIFSAFSLTDKSTYFMDNFDRNRKKWQAICHRDGQILRKKDMQLF